MNLSKLVETAQSNVGFLLISALIIAFLLAVAYTTERVIEKKTGNSTRSGQFKVRRMTLIGAFSAIAIILMRFEFPLWFVPEFHVLDCSIIPIVIGTLTLGPVAGMVIELIKIILNLIINGTDSAFVGEFVNFLFGCAYIIPVSIFYFENMGMKDLQEGMVLKGTVRNVIDFGAFVDIGVHRDGFVHISQMSNEPFVKHPRDIVKVGDIVEVRVLRIDLTKKSIQLSMIL